MRGVLAFDRWWKASGLMFGRLRWVYFGGLPRSISSSASASSTIRWGLDWRFFWGWDDGELRVDSCLRWLVEGSCDFVSFFV